MGVEKGEGTREEALGVGGGKTDGGGGDLWQKKVGGADGNKNAGIGGGVVEAGFGEEEIGGFR